MKNIKKIFLPLLIALLTSTSLFAKEGPLIENKLQKPTNEKKQTLQKRAFVWIEGQWKIQDNKYVWEEGHWEIKRIGYVFINGSWIKKSKGWTWNQGYWKKIDLNKWMALYS